METGETLLQSEVPPLSPCARSCALSPNGSVAVAGFDDGSLKVCSYIYMYAYIDISSSQAYCY